MSHERKTDRKVYVIYIVPQSFPQVYRDFVNNRIYFL